MDFKQQVSVTQCSPPISKPVWYQVFSQTYLGSLLVCNPSLSQASTSSLPPSLLPRGEAANACLIVHSELPVLFSQAISPSSLLTGGGGHFLRLIIRTTAGAPNLSQSYARFGTLMGSRNQLQGITKPKLMIFARCGYIKCSNVQRLHQL